MNSKPSILTIHSKAHNQSIQDSLLTDLTEKVYRGEKISLCRQTSLVLCSDYLIKKLNAKYRKKDRPTDVLSFPFDDSDFLGEVYISLPRAKVQARQYGFTFEQEVLRLFLHGLLHLAGYDHHGIAQRDGMEARERRYLRFTHG